VSGEAPVGEPEPEKPVVLVKSTSPVMTSTGWPVMKQMALLIRVRGAMRKKLCILSETHFVRMPASTAAVAFTASGPPMVTGAPAGTAITVEPGALTGKPHVDTIEPEREADMPPKVTVWLPEMTMPVPHAVSFGAKDTPGGVGRWGTRILTPVAAVTAGRPLMSTGPAPRAQESISPSGSMIAPR
jgi:hypothetical protein